MSSAEGTSVEAPQAPRGLGLGRSVPSPIRQGSGEGALPLPRIFFNFLPRNGAFFEHSDTIRQFTRPVAISLKACKSADVRANAKCLLYSTKKTTFSRFVSFIKLILW